MNWHTTYTKTSHTQTARPTPGYCYEVVTRQDAISVKVYATTPDEARRQVASVPTPDIGILVAERLWEFQFRGMHTIEEIKQIRQAEATVQYLIEVPEHQIMSAQDTLPFLYGTVCDMRMLHGHQAEPDTTALLHPPSLWKAARLVNQRLSSQGLEPLLREPALTHALTPTQAHELTLFLQRHFTWDREQDPLEDRWKRTGMNWADIAAQHPELFHTTTTPNPA